VSFFFPFFPFPTFFFLFFCPQIGPSVLSSFPLLPAKNSPPFLLSYPCISLLIRPSFLSFSVMFKDSRPVDPPPEFRSAKTSPFFLSEFPRYSLSSRNLFFSYLWSSLLFPMVTPLLRFVDPPVAFFPLMS